jgi:hypothetical protein
MLHPVTATQTPFEMVTGSKPDISDLRLFSAVVFYKLSDDERKMSSDPRFKEKALKGILLGRARLVEGGYVIHPEGTRKPIVRKQVLVIEAKATHVLFVYSDRYQLGDPLSTKELTIPQADAAAADAERPIGTRSVAKRLAAEEATKLEDERARGVPDDAPTPQWDAPLTRAQAGVGRRREGVEVTCIASDDAPPIDEPMASTLPPKPRSLAAALLIPEWAAALAKE